MLRLFICALLISAPAIAGVFEEQEVPSIDDSIPDASVSVPTLSEVVRRLQADDSFQETNFRLCVGGDCTVFQKQNFKAPEPKPAPSPTDIAGPAERIAAGLMRATGGRVKVDFTYKQKVKAADGSMVEQEITVSFDAASGAAASGMEDAMQKSHK